MIVTTQSSARIGEGSGVGDGVGAGVGSSVAWGVGVGTGSADVDGANAEMAGVGDGWPEVAPRNTLSGNSSAAATETMATTMNARIQPPLRSTSVNSWDGVTRTLRIGLQQRVVAATARKDMRSVAEPIADGGTAPSGARSARDRRIGTATLDAPAGRGVNGIRFPGADERPGAVSPLPRSAPLRTMRIASEGQERATILRSWPVRTVVSVR
mgnify:CR=1 FL=1